MNTKTIITALAIGAVAVGAYFYFKKSDTPIKKNDTASGNSESKSECGGCAAAL